MAEYAIGRRAPFVLVPRSLIEDPNIDPHTLATYIALVYHADFGKGTGAYPSDEKAATLVGMSRRTFIDRRHKLKETGWLDWLSGRSDGITNKYIVHQNDQGGVQEMQTPCAGDAEGGVQEMHTTKNQFTKDTIPTEEFDSIWSFWEDRRATALRLNGNRRPMARTKKRVQAVNRIWKLGYRRPEFQRAIAGCTSSDFHIDRGFLDIELICRDQEHFERFLLHGKQAGSQNGKTPTAEQTKDMVKRLYG